MTDAEILAAALEILRRAEKPATSLTLAQLYALYVPFRSKLGGWASVRSRLDSVVKSVYADGVMPLGQRDVMSLRVLDWSDWRAWKAGQHYRTGKTYSDHTLNLHLDALRALINWGVSEGRLPHNPLAMAKHVGKRGWREYAPTEIDIVKLLTEANPIERYIVLASNDAGMRLNELRLCKHEWVDELRGRISLEAKVCKGKKSRTVPATKRLLDAISSLPRHFRSPYILHRPSDGEPYGKSIIGSWWRSLRDRAGLPNLVLHDGRHHLASASVERGVDLDTVRKQMGHTNIATTMIYVQTRPTETYGPALAAYEAGIAAELEKTRKNSPSGEKNKR